MGPDLVVVLSRDRGLFDPLCHTIELRFPDAEIQILSSAETLLGRLQRFTADALVLDERSMSGVTIEQLSHRQPLTTMLLLAEAAGDTDVDGESTPAHPTTPARVHVLPRDKDLKRNVLLHLENLGQQPPTSDASEVLEACEDPVFVTVADEIRFVNPAFCEVLGLRPADLVGAQITDFVAPQRRADISRTLRRIATGARPAADDPGLGGRFDLPLLRDGEPTVLEVSGRASLVRGRLAVVGMARRRELAGDLEIDRARERRNRLLRLGELAAGAAHDFNNALATIMGRLERALATAGRTAQRRSAPCDDVRVALKAAQGAASIAKRIQNFAKPAGDWPGVRAEVDLSRLIEDAAEMVDNRVTEGTALTVHSAATMTTESPCAVRGDPQELLEVVVNLLNNALDAINAERSAAENSARSGAIELRCGVDSGRPMLMVRDNGPGMSQEVSERIFEPFFTTKGDAGCGLGLSVSRWILLRHDAELEVHSEVGKGSTFTIFFETASHGLATGRQLINPLAPMRVLVVDDDQTVRSMIGDLLTDDGHRVIVVERAKDAEKLITEANFDLLLTDLNLEDMSGWTLASRTRSLHQEIVIGVMSGWKLDTPTEELQQRGVDFFIDKPFSTKNLIDTLKRLRR